MIDFYQQYTQNSSQFILRNHYMNASLLNHFLQPLIANKKMHHSPFSIIHFFNIQQLLQGSLRTPWENISQR
ncbi:hypothetical protein FGO68_gene11717 [Halteria grandinella]|uniref:Uncharacterized protein n=1 Tax=Halteria grandinella TaxID=5974 RepID=A0A8J8SVB5_HALGN|nr:hypothetical protein FGO68_gene11717 [Halteria grandinella]